MGSNHRHYQNHHSHHQNPHHHHQNHYFFFNQNLHYYHRHQNHRYHQNQVALLLIQLFPSIFGLPQLQTATPLLYLPKITPQFPPPDYHLQPHYHHHPNFSQFYHLTPFKILYLHSE